MMEKYLNDTLTAETQADVDRLSKINLFPHQIFDWRRKQDSAREQRIREKARQMDSAALAKAKESKEMKTAKSSNHKKDKMPVSPLVDNRLSAILPDYKSMIIQKNKLVKR